MFHLLGSGKIFPVISMAYSALIMTSFINKDQCIYLYLPLHPTLTLLFYSFKIEKLL